MRSFPVQRVAGQALRGRRSRRRIRRGYALVDAIVAGIILAVGLAAIIALSARALALQRQGEVQLIAATLLDELLATVVMEGPTDFREMYDTFGRYPPPFQDYEFFVKLEDRGRGSTYRVTANVRHRPTDIEYSVETYIGDREGDDPNPVREPPEPIDRESIYDERW